MTIAVAVTGRATTSGSVEQAGSAHRGVHRRGGCLTWTEQREMGESLNVEGSIMSLHSLLGRSASITVAVTLALLAWAPPAHARITRIVIDNTATVTGTGQTIAYESIAGRAFGELDPHDRHNSIITDILSATDSDGKVRYVTSFFVVKPVDMSQASGFMWHDVPNRGGRITIVATERNLGDVGLSSGWQGDNASAPNTLATRVPDYATSINSQTGNPNLATNEWVKVPVARNRDGSSISGNMLGRIVNRSGPDSQPLNVMNNPIPYLPASLDTSQATLVTHTRETVNGVVTVGSTISSSDWAFARCDATHPFPGTPQDLDPTHLPGSLPVHICLKNGFDSALLYQVIYRVKDPYVLGVGFAAFRDVNSFFKHATQDDFGTLNPVAGKIQWSVIRGVSQSGNFTRAYIHLGFNEDERKDRRRGDDDDRRGRDGDRRGRDDDRWGRDDDRRDRDGDRRGRDDDDDAGRRVHDGAWPIIAGRRVSLDSRWAQPDGVLELYQMGSEGPQWWVKFPDRVRNLPARGILDRCKDSDTCPKIFEHFGGSEVFALKMTTEWVGTSADVDIPLPDNVRRYYVGSTTHGGGGGGFNANIPNTPANCPGNNWGRGIFRANPVPEAQLVNVLRLAMRNWLMHGTLPPPSRWPTLAGGTLVDPTQQAMGFPSGIPGISSSIFDPTNFVFPVFDYDWGPFFDDVDATGVPTRFPPKIEHVIKMKVPKVDADGNELGGVPTVLRDAPLGTYLGWNITSAGFHQGQVCNYVGGMIPFARTKAERDATGDPRLSLVERYKDHAGYVLAVTNAAKNAVAQGYLLQEDADALIAAAGTSNVLNP